MIKKNDKLILDIIDLSVEGQGVARYEGLAIFVKNALLGERVSATILSVKKTYCYAKTDTILLPSNDRVTPACPHFFKCGGCTLMHMSYAAQKKFKENKLNNTLKKIGKVDVDKIDSVHVIESSRELCYRNKLSMPVREVDGKISAGLFRGNSHDLIPMEKCLLQTEKTLAPVKILLDYMNENVVSAYNETTGRGTVRHIVVRAVSDITVVTIVLNDRKLKNADKLSNSLKEKIDNVSLYYNYNTKNNNVILGDEFVHISGEPCPKITLQGLSVQIHPASFFQVNDDIAFKLFNAVTDIVKNISPDVVVDAYSGAGFMTMLLSRYAKKAYGIEIVPEAVADAKNNAAANGITNIDFILGDCAEKLPPLISGLKDEKFCLVLDPPRKGCDEKVINSILLSAPKNIVYISCDPATLSRDICRLSDKYKVTLIKPFDMFPQTPHMETLALLELV